MAAFQNNNISLRVRYCVQFASKGIFAQIKRIFVAMFCTFVFPFLAHTVTAMERLIHRVSNGFMRNTITIKLKTDNSNRRMRRNCLRFVPDQTALPLINRSCRQQCKGKPERQFDFFVQQIKRKYTLCKRNTKFLQKSQQNRVTMVRFHKQHEILAFSYKENFLFNRTNSVLLF